MLGTRASNIMEEVRLCSRGEGLFLGKSAAEVLRRMLPPRVLRRRREELLRPRASSS